MIRPHLEYGDFIVGTANQNFINKLDRLQDKVVRLAEYQTYENRQDISDLMNVLGIEKLEIPRNRSLLNLMYTESKIPSNIEESKDYDFTKYKKG